MVFSHGFTLFTMLLSKKGGTNEKHSTKRVEMVDRSGSGYEYLGVDACRRYISAIHFADRLIAIERRELWEQEVQ